MKKPARLRLPAIACCLVLVGCGSGAPAAPPHKLTGQQRIARFIVIAPELADQAEALWQIADYLRRDMPNQTIQAMFWTGKADAATGLPLTDRAVEAHVAQININPVTNLRQLMRPTAREGIGR